jgi:CDP-diacylglycerol--glycerol-3-phosphate 3-phosphatidyltransferase
MNVPNKITACRIVLSVFLMVLMIFPLNKLGIAFPEIKVAADFIIDSKYLICGVIFIIAATTDFLDGYLARKYNLVTDMGKIMDAIADKLLVNGVLIILAVEGYISVIVPVVIVCRDIAVDSIKMVAGQKSGAVAASKAGKIKTACMLTGVSLLFFYDLPLSFIKLTISGAVVRLKVSRILIMIATVLSVFSGIQYFDRNKKFISTK